MILTVVIFWTFSLTCPPSYSWTSVWISSLIGFPTYFLIGLICCEICFLTFLISSCCDFSISGIFSYSLTCFGISWTSSCWLNGFLTYAIFFSGFDFCSFHSFLLIQTFSGVFCCSSTSTATASSSWTLSL